MKCSLRSLAESLQAQLLGDGAVEISGIASIPQATPEDLVFVEEEKHLRGALESGAAAIIAGRFAEKFLANAAPKTPAKPLLIAAQPKLAFARAAKLLRVPSGRPLGIHASAVVHASVRLGQDAIVAARAVIG